MIETRISSPEDFPNLAVYRRPGAVGTVYRVVFDNLEYMGGFAALPRIFVGVGALMLAVPGFFWVGISLGKISGAWAAVGMLAWFIALVAVFSWLTSPGKVRRVIELDPAADRLRVLKNGRVEIERALSRLVDLGVMDHPKAEYERQQRQQMRPDNPDSRKISDAEKQHCLMGYFGVGGAEQVMLLCRAEWPTFHSLRDVQQAIHWTKGIIESQRGGRDAEPESMNPPRD